MRVGERHRLDLVVGDVDHGRARVAVQGRDLDTGLDPQRRVEVGERLVEQEHLRVAHDRAADGDALALAARELARLAVEQVRDPEPLGRLPDARVDVVPRLARELEPERHVVVGAHMRVERVGLEHHRDAALLRGEVVHHDVVDQDLAGIRVLEARDEAQQGRLPAARRADEDDELARPDRQVDAADHGRAPEGFRQPAQHDPAHPAHLPHPFTAPAVSPATMRRWKTRTSAMTGMVTITDAAMIAPQGSS